VLFLWLLGAIAGPVLGFALVFTTIPPWAINFFGSLVFALLLPYLVLARTLLYLDLAARKEQSPSVHAVAEVVG
jgi:MFS family permease